MEKKSNKGIIVVLVILILAVLGLGGYIVYDKFFTKDEVKKYEPKTEKKEKLKQPEWDLSLVPKTEQACTYNVNMDDVNNDVRETKKLCSGKLTKYIVSNVKVDGIEQNIQIVSYDYADTELENEKLYKLSGVYLNGVKVVPGLSFQDWISLSLHNNLFFIHLDGGTSITGTVNVFAFDKMGKEVYNLKNNLEKSNIIESIALEANQVVTVNDILRNGVNISDSEITFKSYMTQGSPCVKGYRGSVYKVSYKGTDFGKIENAGGWKYDNDNCTEALN